MRGQSSTSDVASSCARSCCKGDEASSILSMDLPRGSIDPDPDLQTLRSLEVELPEEIADPEFFGIDTDTAHRCHHQMHPAKKVAFVCAATGRRFLGCPFVGDERCRRYVWIDEPWGPILTRSLIRLWEKAVARGDKATTLKSKKKEIQHAYLEMWTETSQMKIEHDEVVRELKEQIVETKTKMSRRLDLHTKLCVAVISSAVTLASVLAYVLTR